MSLSEKYIKLENRALITVAGEDAFDFLQAIVSADLNACRAGKAVWAALLTPQGKYLFDFFVTLQGSEFWLDCEASRMMDLGRLLGKYKLRARVDLGIGTGKKFYATGKTDSVSPQAGFVEYLDPRHKDIGCRIIAPGSAGDVFAKAGLQAGDFAVYESLRLALGLPDASRDMTPEKAVLMENGFDELGGIGWEKGCFVGQELTARMKYRALVKKRLLPVRFAGPLPAAGSEILIGGKNAGEIKSGCKAQALALLRLERISDISDRLSLMVDDMPLQIHMPDWVRLVNN